MQTHGQNLVPRPVGRTAGLAGISDADTDWGGKVAFGVRFLKAAKLVLGPLLIDADPLP
ncbi:MAG: hypothetical protein KC470_13955 [Dehalococcoidia bacterium]|nr:hypothetical protein [Dehalococcoidia bacterium]